ETSKNNKALTILGVSGTTLTFDGDPLKDETSAALIRSSGPVPSSAPADLYSQLALLVQADNISVSDADQTRKIQWDSDVEVSAGASPEVVIDENGTGVKGIGASVDVTQAGKAVVGDIHGGGGGQVVFISDEILNDTADSGNNFIAQFNFFDSYAGVSITNQSA